MPNAKPVTKRDPAAPAPTPKPPKVGSLPKPPKPPKPKTTQAGVSMTSVTMKAEKPPHRIVPSGGSSQKYGPCEVCKQSASDIQIYAGRPDGKVTFGHKECLEKLRSKEIHKSEPTAILDAARVDAEVERRLAAIEGAREDLQKGLHPNNKLKYAEEKATNSSQIARDSNDPTHHDNAAFWSRKAAKVAREQGKEALAGYHESVAKFHDSKGTGQQPIAKSESDHVKEFVLGLDLGGTRRWHSACVSKDDSNLGRAVKGKQADRTYSREGSRGVPGICTGCGGELQMDPAPREVDAPVHGEDHNEHKIEKGEKMSNEEVRGHLQQRADEHQKAGRKADADAMRAKIAQLKEKHGMGPAPLGKAEVAIGQTRSGKNVMAPSRQHIQAEAAFAKAVGAYGHHHPEIDRAANTLQEHHVQHMKQHQGFSAEDHEDASKLHQKLANSSQMGAGTRGDIHKDLMNTHDVAAKTVRSGGKPYWENETQKSELLAGARHHYARVVRFQQLGKSEEVAKSATMCALYVAKMGGDPSKDVPAEVRNCGPVDLQKASFRLDREVRGLPAKMLPLIKATPPNFGSSLGEEERRRDETPIHGHRDLGLKLMSWHSSMHDPIYGTGSTFHAGKPVPKWQVQATLDNISKLHQEAQTPEGAQRGGWGPAEVRELGGIKNHLTRLLKTPKAPIQKALTGAPGDTAPGATMDGGALELAEDAKHGAKEVCAECKQPISYHQHSRKWNHSNTQDSEKPHQSVRVRPEGWSSAWHKSVEKAEKSDVIGEVGKSGSKTLDIGDGC